MRMTSEAERIWQDFLSRVRSAAPADVDADDLEETLQVHLQSLVPAGKPLGRDDLEQIIGDIQRDLLAEFEIQPSRAEASASPNWANLVLFGAAIFVLPQFGLVPLIGSWIFSRYLLTRKERTHLLDALPSFACAVSLLLLAPSGLGLMTSGIVSELVAAPTASYFALAVGTGLIAFAALLGMRLRLPKLFEAIFLPLNRFLTIKRVRVMVITAIPLSVVALLFSFVLGAL